LSLIKSINVIGIYFLSFVYSSIYIIWVLKKKSLIKSPKICISFAALDPVCKLVVSVKQHDNALPLEPTSSLPIKICTLFCYAFIFKTHCLWFSFGTLNCQGTFGYISCATLAGWLLHNWLFEPLHCSAFHKHFFMVCTPGCPTLHSIKTYTCMKQKPQNSDFAIENADYLQWHSFLDMSS
jgi:hypothetical protein